MSLMMMEGARGRLLSLVQIPGIAKAAVAALGLLAALRDTL